MSHFTSLNTFILKFADFSDQELSSFNKMCIPDTFKKGEIMIEKDVYTTSLYFLTKGIVKYYIMNQNGQEIIYNFRQENMIVSSYTYYNNYIAKYSVECLEDCKVISIPIEAITHLLENCKNGILLRYKLAEAHILELMHLLTDKDTKRIIERYNNIDIQFPNINQRVSQNALANYLGVSQEHLSRLKKARIDKSL
jgi:CRP-like cAMP-binding protein